MSIIHEERSIISLIKSCSRKSHLLQLHSYLLRTSYFYNSTIFNSFLSHFALPPFQDLSYSSRIFKDFPNPDVFLYNTMIRAHSLKRDSALHGLLLYQELLHLGISSTAFSSTFALSCCMKIKSLVNGLQIHSRIFKDGNLSDSFLLTSLMEFYSGLEKSEAACKLFDEMPHRDIVSWNVLISCYIRSGRKRDVLALFDMMKDSNGCQPDDVTCLLVLQVCASLNALEFGTKVHKYVVEKGIINNRMMVCNSLIAMYSRCGCAEKAYGVFKEMDNKDVVTWTAMISGLASNGYGKDALEALEEMRKAGVSPDHQTFTGVLSACSHSKLVEEGRKLFNSMKNDFGVTPNIHHYGCMVDLLGRAGLLEEAYDLIKSMNVQADAKMWRTLLGACRIHLHVTLSERVIEHLIELKAQETGDYILLLNIYSSLGNWDKVIEVRKVMRDKGIESTPASSSIEMKGKVYEFIADDISNPRKKEVYEMLDEINQQLRIAGYVYEKNNF